MEIGFLTVHVKNIEESIAFYTGILGFTVTRRFSPRPGMDITFVDDKHGGQVEFIHDDKVPPYSGSGLSLGFNVEDIIATERHLRQNGVEILTGPVTMGNGVKLLHARDCNGLELGFVQPLQR